MNVLFSEPYGVFAGAVDRSNFSTPSLSGMLSRSALYSGNAIERAVSPFRPAVNRSDVFDGGSDWVFFVWLVNCSIFLDRKRATQCERSLFHMIFHDFSCFCICSSERHFISCIRTAGFKTVRGSFIDGACHVSFCTVPFFLMSQYDAIVLWMGLYRSEKVSPLYNRHKYNLNGAHYTKRSWGSWLVFCFQFAACNVWCWPYHLRCIILVVGLERLFINLRYEVNVVV